MIYLLSLGLLCAGFSLGVSVGYRLAQASCEEDADADHR